MMMPVLGEKTETDMKSYWPISLQLPVYSILFEKLFPELNLVELLQRVSFTNLKHASAEILYCVLKAYIQNRHFMCTRTYCLLRIYHPQTKKKQWQRLLALSLVLCAGSSKRRLRAALNELTTALTETSGYGSSSFETSRKVSPLSLSLLIP